MRLPAQIAAALEATGAPWDITRGGNHLKLRVAGRLVSVLPCGGWRDKDRRAVRNTVADIRRVARELQP